MMKSALVMGLAIATFGTALAARPSVSQPSVSQTSIAHRSISLRSVSPALTAQSINQSIQLKNLLSPVSRNANPEVLAAQSPQASDVLITMQRTACFGSCPVYELTIYEDGRVVYSGTAYVAVQDTRTAQLTPAQVQQLLTAFEQANFFDLKDEYIANATDLPGTWTSITQNGRSKKIWHYGSIDNSQLNTAPAALTQLENTIDAIVNTQQWIGR